MRVLREWVQRVWATVRPGRHDEDLAEELRLHMELAAERGRRETGAAQAMEALRDQRGWSWADHAVRDVRYASRVLRRSPIFTAVAILSLALGIGANAAIFQLIDTLQFRALGVDRPQELVEVHADGTSGFGINDGANGHVTYPLWEQMREHQDAFSAMFAWGDAALLAGRGRDARVVQGLWVSGEFFRVLGTTAHRGRLLSSADDRRGCGAGGVVVSYDFWHAALGGTDAVVGHTLTVMEQPFTIVGVTPPGFMGVEIGRGFDVALPLCSAALWESRLDQRDRWWLTVIGRLKPGWTIARATEHLHAISPGLLAATLPEGYGAELLDRYRGFRFGAFAAGRGVSRLRDEHGTSLSLLLALTGLVLLVTCGNLATLMIARATAREREIAVRVAIGASRRRLVAQMTTESLLLAVAGAALAVPVAVFSARALVSFLDSEANRVALHITADWRLMAFIAAAAGLTTVLFGVMPALRASIVAPGAAGRQASRGVTRDRRGAAVRRGLVAAQVALAVVLAVSAGLFVRTFRNLATVDLGFDSRGTLVVSFVDLGGGALPVEQRIAFQRRLRDEIGSAPGITAAASSSHFPLIGGTWAHFFKVPAVFGGSSKVSRFAYVDPEYFSTLNVPILAGRGFDSHDQARSQPVLIVNEGFVRRHLGGRNPIGLAIRTVAEAGYPETTYEVIGVVKDTKYTDLRDENCWCEADVNEAMPPVAYVPTAQNPSVRLVHCDRARRRSRRGSDRGDHGTRRAAESRDHHPRHRSGGPDWRAAGHRTHGGVARGRVMLAVVLVSIGLYGLIAYLGRRTEIGVRLSLGSTRAQIVRLVLRDSVPLVLAGALIGIPLAIGALRGAGALLFGVSSTDVPTFVGATVLLATVAIVAGGIPAWRAARLDPIVVLRAEQ